jgi:predicted site-specific integrase-resolvase
MPEVARNTDELIQQMMDDELRDQMELLGKMTPREFAKLKGMAPQQIYYYIRAGKIEVEKCICGRHVIDTEKANTFLTSRKQRGQILQPEVSTPEEVSGSDLDAGE